MNHFIFCHSAEETKQVLTVFHCFIWIREIPKVFLNYRFLDFIQCFLPTPIFRCKWSVTVTHSISSTNHNVVLTCICDVTSFLFHFIRIKKEVNSGWHRDGMLYVKTRSSFQWFQFSLVFIAEETNLTEMFWIFCIKYLFGDSSHSAFYGCS